MLKNHKILLIGGTGFVGRHLARVLVDAGVQVTVPTRRYEKHRDITMLPTVSLVEADIQEPGVLETLMVGQDAVINLVGVLHSDPAIPYGKQFAEAHVNVVQRIVDACQKVGVKRLLHMSALRADAKAPSEYLRSKAAGEAIVRHAAGLVTTIFRPSVIFGAGDRFINTFAGLLEKFPVFPLGCPDARFQPVSLNDVADAFVNALKNPAMEGQVYDLCGPKVYTLREIVAYTGEVIARPRKILPLSEGFAYLQAGILSSLPTPLMSPDNIRSMQIDSVCSKGCNVPPGWHPATLESVVPLYLLGSGDAAQFAEYRSRAGR